MIQPSEQFSDDLAWPRWWRLTIVGLSVLILCSCRGVPLRETAAPIPDTERTEYEAAAPVYDADRRGFDAMPVSYETAVDPAVGCPPADGNTLPPTAWTGACPCVDQQWAPPGIKRPWPTDEYLCDGGDQGIQARVNRDWSVNGLQMEDTIAHYDTLDGRVVVEPTNKVCIYAPRFGSVRRVVGAGGYDGKEALVRYDVPTGVEIEHETLVPNTTLQQVQADQSINTKRARAQQRNNPGLQVANNFGLIEANNRTKVHENLRVLQDGVYQQAEEPRLAMRAEAAAIWTIDKGIQVILDDTTALAVDGDARVQATFAVDHESKPKLRIRKMASSDAAQPGDIIDFTLQFNNIGNEPIGNVTIIDNLTTRLQYVADSEESTLKAKFLTQTNAGESLVLRWEILDPVPAGEGGTIRFKCRVR